MTPQIKRGLNHIFKTRRTRGLAQKQLALLLGHRYTDMVSKYENGTSLPPLEIALLLDIALGIRLPELYVELYQDLQRVVLERSDTLPPELRRGLVGRLLGKDHDEHS